MKLYTVAAKNIKQNGLRSVAIIVAMSVLSGILFSLSLIYSSLGRSVELSSRRLGADAMIVPAEYSEKTEDILLTGRPGSFYMKDTEQLRAQLLKTEGVETVSAQLFIVSAALACCTVSDTMLIGYEPETDFVIAPWILENINQGHVAPDEIVVGANILAGVGGWQKFYGQEFRIIGKLEAVGMPFIDNAVFIPMPSARRMIAESKDKALKTLTISPEEFTSLLVKLKNDMPPERFALRVERDHPDKKVLTTSSILSNAKRSLIVPLKGMSILFVLQWAVSLFLVWVIYKISIDERRAELGVMKALGANKADIGNLLLLEIAILSGSGGLVGILCGYMFVNAFSGLLMLAYKVPFLMPDTMRLFFLSAVVFAATLCSGILSSYFTATKWAKVEPFHLMKGGQIQKGVFDDNV